MRQSFVSLFAMMLFAAATHPASAQQHVTVSDSAGAAEAIEFPDSVAGKAMAMWYNAMNSRDPQQIQAYIDRYHRESTVDDYLGQAQYFGRWQLVRIEESTANKLTIWLVGENSDALYSSSMTIDADDPTVISAADFREIERPADLAIPRLDQAQALAALDQRAATLFAEDRFAGALLVAKNGETIYNQAWGEADRQQHIANSSETKFRLASAGKMFTGVAILQLVDRGKLSLDGKLGDYLPDYPNRELAQKVTIRHLLTHTGGTGEIFTADYLADINDFKTHQDYIDKFGTRGLEFEPGTQESYSNYGMILLGYIIERVSGMSYYDFVDAHIFKPAAMIHSGFLPEDMAVDGRAIGYTQEGGAWISNIHSSLPYRGTAAGGGYSTVNDLKSFADALNGGKLLSPAMLTAISSPQVASGWYSYGFQIRGKGRLISFGHSGGAPGMNADVRIYPHQSLVIIALSNMDGPYAESLASFCEYRLPLEEFDVEGLPESSNMR